MIEVKNLKKSYGDLPILKGVDLTIKEGEILSIVGASGAGKTTLLQILGTLDTPNEGEVFYDGISIFGLNANKLAKFRNENIGFIFQFHNLLPEFTALENVLLPSILGEQKDKLAKSRAMDLLARLGLENRISHKPNQLSGGEQQRVAIARALINNPKVILADEPSGNLDSNNAEELHNLFFQLREEFNQTFVIVTHNDTLAEISDRKIVMKDGVVSL